MCDRRRLTFGGQAASPQVRRAVAIRDEQEALAIRREQGPALIFFVARQPLPGSTARNRKQLQVGAAAAPIAFARPLPAPRTGDRPAVRCRSRIAEELVILRDQPGRAGFDAHGVDRRIARRLSGRSEKHVLAVGCPARHEIIRAVHRQLAGLAARRRHDPDIIVAFALGGEGDPFPIRGPGGRIVVRLVNRKADGGSACRVHGPDVAQIGEGQPGAVGRKRGLTREMDRTQALLLCSARRCAGQEGKGGKGKDWK